MISKEQLAIRVKRLKKVLSRGINPMDPRAGYTQFPNMWLDIQFLFDPNEWAIICQFIRRTIGFHRKNATLSVREVMSATNTCESVTRRALKNLVGFGVLIEVERGGGRGKKKVWTMATRVNQLDLGAMITGFCGLQYDPFQVADHLAGKWANLMPTDEGQMDMLDGLEKAAVVSSTDTEVVRSRGKDREGIAAALQTYQDQGDSRAGVADPTLEKADVARALFEAFVQLTGVSVKTLKTEEAWLRIFRNILLEVVWSGPIDEAVERMKILWDNPEFSWFKKTSPHNKKFQEDLTHVLMLDLNAPSDEGGISAEELQKKRGY